MCIKLLYFDTLNYGMIQKSDFGEPIAQPRKPSRHSLGAEFPATIPLFVGSIPGRDQELEGGALCRLGVEDHSLLPTSTGAYTVERLPRSPCANREFSPGLSQPVTSAGHPAGRRRKWNLPARASPQPVRDLKKKQQHKTTLHD